MAASLTVLHTLTSIKKLLRDYEYMERSLLAVNETEKLNKPHCIKDVEHFWVPAKFQSETMNLQIRLENGLRKNDDGDDNCCLTYSSVNLTDFS